MKAIFRDLRVSYRDYTEPTFCGTYCTLFQFVLYPSDTVLRAAFFPVFLDVLPHVSRFEMLRCNIGD